MNRSLSGAHSTGGRKGLRAKYFWLEGGVGVLSQNHSWDGLTRPARINDSLRRLQQAPQPRCAEPSPGPRRALDSARALAPRPRGSQVGLGRLRWGAGCDGVPGNQAAEAWNGGGEEALCESRRDRGAPSGCAPASALRAFSSPQRGPRGGVVATSGARWAGSARNSNPCPSWSREC